MMQILENMKKNDKFIGDVLAPFEQALGMKFNKFDKPEDPKYVAPKRVNYKLNLKKAQRKQEKLAKLGPEHAAWDKAMDKAKGIKIKDDPKIIRKKMKRKMDEKRRHRKNWSERLAKGVKGRGEVKPKSRNRKNSRNSVNKP